MTTPPPNTASPPSVRMDMHLHSSASSKPALPYINCPECLSPPEAVYDQARARAMTFITLTDHDTITGALELQDRGFPNIILAEEVTTRFPEHPAPIHCLIWNLTPNHHEQVHTLNLRTNIYDLAHWLKEHNLPHAIAHPLDNIAAPGAIERLERLALLFRAFETLNGAHAGAHALTAQRWVQSLTPTRLQYLSQKHSITPLWQAHATTAGSDDHALLNAGTTYTTITKTSPNEQLTPTDFLTRVMQGEAVLTGQPSTPQVLAHQFAAVAAHRYAKPITTKLHPRRKPLARTIAALAGVHIKQPSLTSRVRAAFKKRPANPSTLADSLATHLPKSLAKLTTKTNPPLADHTASAAITDQLLTQLTQDLAAAALPAITTRDWKKLRALTSDAAALALAHAPDIAAITLHNKDRHGIHRLEKNLNPSFTPKPTRVALFADTLTHTNGVSRFITQLNDWATKTNHDLHIFTFAEPNLPAAPNIHAVKPILTTPLPAYPDHPLRIPPLLPLLRKLHTLQPDAIHISTPGPLGLAAALAARTLNTPLLATHHTNFPDYINCLTNDPALTNLSKRALRHLYKTCTTVFARSDASIPDLQNLGLQPTQILTLPPGVNTKTFSPTHRDPTVWNNRAHPNSLKVLYAGRVSTEKNTRFLESIWKHINQRCIANNIHAQLIIVGDGPDRPRLQQELTPHNAIFLTTKPTKELATLYASSDLFLFPSTTDTLAQVALEAQASGLPAIVSTTGGPAHIVKHQTTGYTLPATNPTTHQEAWITTTIELLTNQTLRKDQSTAARHHSLPRTTETTHQTFWTAHESAINARRNNPTSPPHIPDIPTTLLTQLAAL